MGWCYASGTAGPFCMLNVEGPAKKLIGRVASCELAIHSVNTPREPGRTPGFCQFEGRYG